MSKRIRLLPECHADTTLIGFLVKNRELYRHSLGSEVANDMKSASRDFDLVIGIIDGDKTSKPRYFDAFEFVSEENNVQLWQKTNSKVEYLIVIIGKRIGIEAFMLQNAEQVGVSLYDYGFEATVKRLRPRFKSIGIEADSNYQQFLTDLYTRKAPGFLTLERILNDLIISN